VPNDLRRHWALASHITFLNHGSFGACPTAVLDAQSRLRAQLEAEPVRFMECDLEPLWERARGAVATFVGASPASIAFVANATSGIGAVLRSLQFAPGDELLTTNHEYPGSRNALAYVARRAGAELVVADVPFPLTSAHEVIDAIVARVTPRTKLALIDHVTSATGLVLPIAEIVAELAARGIDTIVDGAHAPGMVDLDIDSIGAAYYVANCHKWMCAPKGAAVLSVREDRREEIHPLTISLGYEGFDSPKSAYHREFDWMGTRDPTAVLCVPEALEHLAGLVTGGWPAIRQRNRDLALETRALLCRSLELEVPAPDSMIGSMFAIPVPNGEGLHERLRDELAIEVPVQSWGARPLWLLRVSSFLYNQITDGLTLADALRELGVGPAGATD